MQMIRLLEISFMVLTINPGALEMLVFVSLVIVYIVLL